MSSCTRPKRPADRPAIYNAIVPPKGGHHSAIDDSAELHQVEAGSLVRALHAEGTRSQP